MTSSHPFSLFPCRAVPGAGDRPDPAHHVVLPPDERHHPVSFIIPDPTLCGLARQEWGCLPQSLESSLPSAAAGALTPEMQGKGTLVLSWTSKVQRSQRSFPTWFVLGFWDFCSMEMEAFGASNSGPAAPVGQSEIWDVPEFDVSLSNPADPRSEFPHPEQAAHLPAPPHSPRKSQSLSLLSLTCCSQEENPWSLPCPQELLLV